MITLNHYLIVSSLMFMVGVFGVLKRKNLLMLFFSTEIILSAVSIGFVAVGRTLGDLNGQMFAFFILAVAASEVAVGIGLLMAWYKKHHTLDLDNLQIMEG